MRKLFERIFDKIKDTNFEENELCRKYWLKLKRLDVDYSDDKALELLFENMEWLISTNVVTSKEIRELGDLELMASAGIYFGFIGEFKDCNIILFGYSNVAVTGHSRVRCFDGSEVDADDSGFISAFQNSKVTAKNCKVVVFDQASVKSRGLCLIEDYTEGGNITATDKDLVY